MGPEIGKFDSGQINANQFADRARGREMRKGAGGGEAGGNYYR